MPNGSHLPQSLNNPAPALVPFGGVLGITSRHRCVAYSNGDEDYFSQEAATAADVRLGFSHRFKKAAQAITPAHAGLPSSATDSDAFVRALQTTGVKWQCVEFARRYLLLSKGVWLRSIPVAESIWALKHVVSLEDGRSVPLRRFENRRELVLPAPGDLMIWRRSRDMPFGHVAVVVSVTCEHGGDGGGCSDAALLAHHGDDGTPPPPAATVADDTAPSDGSANDGSGCSTQSSLRCARGVIHVAEQNHEFLDWGERPFGRALAFSTQPCGSIEVHDEDPVLGWIRVDAPDVDFVAHDIADNFYTPITSGTIQRFPAEPCPSLPWLRPHETPTDFFLRRSLLIDGNAGDEGVAAEKDTPNGYYVMDRDMYAHIRRTCHQLHDAALTATWRVLHDANAEALLAHYFGVPVELHGLIRSSLRRLPAMMGRFDLGFDGHQIHLLEYNCDSSAALYECMDTQEKWAQYQGGARTVGHSSGSFLQSKVVEYFETLRDTPALCPPHKLIHFMLDDDDEERYTALCVAQCAQAAGFRFKACVKLVDFRFAANAEHDGELATESARPQESPLRNSTPVRGGSGSHQPGYSRAYLDKHHIVDLDGERVHCVWKTWAWDTVLHQYQVQKEDRIGQAADPSSPPSRPTLSDILLNPTIHTFEPFWKIITGSKALLPFIHECLPDHPCVPFASFERTERMTAKPYLSKPVNGRAGQNITMLNAIADPQERRQMAQDDAARHAPYRAANLTNDSGACTSSHAHLKPSVGVDAAAAPCVSAHDDVCDGGKGDGDPTTASPLATPTTSTSAAAFADTGSANAASTNEVSGGRFFDSLVVYQRRVNLKKFDSYFPIFCGWVVGDQFGGVVVREDTSKITKLGSIVAPCRVVRE